MIVYSIISSSFTNGRYDSWLQYPVLVSIILLLLLVIPARLVSSLSVVDDDGLVHLFVLPRLVSIRRRRLRFDALFLVIPLSES